MEESIRKVFDLKERQIETYSPLSLAYIGDVVYELVIRRNILASGDSSVKENTKRGTFFAKAPTQDKMIEYLLANNHLTEEEETIFKRGRNAYNTHKAKNSSPKEYRYATGFEALIGWLYLQGNDERLLELIRTAWMGIEEEV